MAEVVLIVFRGGREGGHPIEYRVPLVPGMVVLDALHYIQSHLAPDLAVRCNCKAGRCGSCSAEINGRPRLACKTRMDSLPQDKPITAFPMKAFPVIKELVGDVSRNFQVNKKIPPFQSRLGMGWKIQQQNVDRTQEFRKCIERFLRPRALACAKSTEPQVRLAAYRRSNGTQAKNYLQGRNPRSHGQSRTLSLP